MGRHKQYDDEFTSERRLAWVRFLAQCRYRGENVDLTFAEFCRFWHDPQQWHRRGRNPTDLVLTRFDPEQAWSKLNCCIITRKTQLTIRNLRRFNMPVEELYQEAIAYAE